jgi:AcrR family transcriptional regulator
MVHSAAQLIRRQGVSGTGLREIVAEAQAPRGSLQHYFPDGKQQLVSDALAWMGQVASRRVRRHLRDLGAPRPSELLAAIVGDWRRDLEAEGYSAGCPLVAAAADTATSNEEVRQVIREAFQGWAEPLAEALAELGVPAERSRGLAILVICALEGAIILARIDRDPGPLDALDAELGPMLDAAAGNGQG